MPVMSGALLLMKTTQTVTSLETQYSRSRFINLSLSNLKMLSCATLMITHHCFCGLAASRQETRIKRSHAARSKAINYTHYLKINCVYPKTKNTSVFNFR